METLRIICVKWGSKYSAEWVYNLKRMVERHLTVPHRFVCMTDRAIPDVECVEAAEHLPSWWSKVGMFRPGLFPGRNLYLDLDVVITGNIDGMLQFAPGVVAPDDFSYSLLNPKHGLSSDMQRLLGGTGTVNSSVMLWRDDDGLPIYERFTLEKMAELHGDQNWITQCMWPDQLTLLDHGWVCSYKYHVLRGVPAMPIVVFHGDPKVTQLPADDPLRIQWAA
jgi:hypothetical protein